MEISKLRKVNLRAIWEKEDKNFTPWLAKNIDHLNEAINLDITVLKVEEYAGPYKVDIYGEDGDGNKVIIENQLERTDHTHLGQILTYLVNLDAKVAVWVTANPVEEHRQVIEWLNETTPEDMFFYLVKIEAVQTEGCAMVAPLFTLVEGPDVVRKQLGEEKKEHARSHVARKNFWTQFLAEINNSGSSLCRNVSPSTDSWIATALGKAGISLNLVVSKNYARAEIYFNMGDQDMNKSAFDHLYNQRSKIEKAFGGPLIWERMDDRVTSRIKCQLDGVNVYDQNDWTEMNKYMIDVLPRMNKAFLREVQEIPMKSKR